jgi:hypothetical protein
MTTVITETIKDFSLKRKRLPMMMPLLLEEDKPIRGLKS